MLKKTLCFLNFNHSFSISSIEEGKGKEFRNVERCKCGKREWKSEWTDDNQMLGHGSR